jgi:hypothetical protein
MDGNRYRAVFTNGLDVAITESKRLGVTQDSWTSLTYNLSGTTDYDTTYNTGAYRKTTAGVVILKGLIKRSSAINSGEVIATLPASYRPARQLIFVVGAYNNTAARIDVRANGEIIYVSGGTPATWISLEGIHFIPNNGRYTSTVIKKFTSPWNSYGNGWLPASYVVDDLNRVHLQGLLSYTGTTPADNTGIFVMPDTLRPSGYMHIPAVCGAFSAIGITSVASGYANTVNTKGSAESGCIPTQVMYHPTSSGVTWNNITFTTSPTPIWTNYGGIFTTAQYARASDGLVSLRGLIKTGTTATSVGVLPAGYRPEKRVLATVDTANGVYGRVDIAADGTIYVVSGSSSWLALDGITFYAP